LIGFHSISFEFGVSPEFLLQSFHQAEIGKRAVVAVDIGSAIINIADVGVVQRRGGMGLGAITRSWDIVSPIMVQR
jgi:hypothetical protein